MIVSFTIIFYRNFKNWALYRGFRILTSSPPPPPNSRICRAPPKLYILIQFHTISMQSNLGGGLHLAHHGMHMLLIQIYVVYQKIALSISKKTVGSDNPFTIFSCHWETSGDKKCYLYYQLYTNLVCKKISMAS